MMAHGFAPMTLLPQNRLDPVIQGFRMFRRAIRLAVKFRKAD